MVKENRDLGTPITEREAADLCRIRDYYERTRMSDNWQRPFFKKNQLEAWGKHGLNYIVKYLFSKISSHRRFDWRKTAGLTTNCI